LNPPFALPGSWRAPPMPPTEREPGSAARDRELQGWKPSAGASSRSPGLRPRCRLSNRQRVFPAVAGNSETRLRQSTSPPWSRQWRASSAGAGAGDPTARVIPFFRTVRPSVSVLLRAPAWFETRSMALGASTFRGSSTLRVVSECRSAGWASEPNGRRSKPARWPCTAFNPDDRRQPRATTVRSPPG
jgi:hypothetical protein